MASALSTETELHALSTRASRLRASLSRVHALLIQVDDAILAIDTASLNGTREVDQPKARLIQLTGDMELVLGTSTRARWHWVS